MFGTGDLIGQHRPTWLGSYPIWLLPDPAEGSQHPQGEATIMSKLPKFDIPGHAHFISTKTNRFMSLFLAHDFCRILLANVDFT